MSNCLGGLRWVFFILNILTYYKHLIYLVVISAETNWIDVCSNWNMEWFGALGRSAEGAADLPDPACDSPGKVKSPWMPVVHDHDLAPIPGPAPASTHIASQSWVGLSELLAQAGALWNCTWIAGIILDRKDKKISAVITANKTLPG